MTGAATVYVEDPTDWLSIFEQAKAGNFVEFLPRNIKYDDEEPIEFTTPEGEALNDD